MKRQRKKYLGVLAEKKAKSKLSAIEQKKRFILMKKKWKASVLIIERERYR